MNQRTQRIIPSISMSESRRDFGQDRFARVYSSQEVAVVVRPRKNCKMACNQLRGLRCIGANSQCKAWCQHCDQFDEIRWSQRQRSVEWILREMEIGNRQQFRSCGS